LQYVFYFVHKRVVFFWLIEHRFLLEHDVEVVSRRTVCGGCVFICTRFLYKLICLVNRPRPHIKICTSRHRETDVQNQWQFGGGQFGGGTTLYASLTMQALMFLLSPSW
jgi:hypothetical protein